MSDSANTQTEVSDDQINDLVQNLLADVGAEKSLTDNITSRRLFKRSNKKGNNSNSPYFKNNDESPSIPIDKVVITLPIGIDRLQILHLEHMKFMHTKYMLTWIILAQKWKFKANFTKKRSLQSIPCLHKTNLTFITVSGMTK